jgi:3-deoxy-D-manno-octulosonic acid hydroxylase-like protein
MNLFTLESRRWDAEYPASVQDAATGALEAGSIIVFPHLSFGLEPEELKFLDPHSVHGAKNVSFTPATGKVGGTTAEGTALDELRGLLDRFSRTTGVLVRALFPSYAPAVQHGRASLRPVEIAGRATSWRADDTRLHVDAFPSMPMKGRRILRVFSNINPSGQPRVWKVGGSSFDTVARRFQSSLRAPMWGSHLGMYLVRMTKDLRSPYDHYMLQLHDRMKADSDYQAEADHVTHSFPAGSTWMVYTDQVPHAALAGIHQLEQTFYVPVSSLRNEASAPLRVLEGLMRRPLA